MAIKDFADRPKARPGDRWLIIEEVADLCRTSTKTIRRWREEKSMPEAYRFGLRLLWLEREVHEWMDTRRGVE